MSKAREKKKTAQKRRVRVLSLMGLCTFFTLLVLSVGAMGILASCGRELPQLENQTANLRAQTSKVYAADGTLLTDLYAVENRVEIPLSDIPENMQAATISIEDRRFFQHKGVDVEAVLRALFINIQKGRIEEGGSTITQQYVKNTFITPERTLTRKVKEAALAYQVEQKYSKKKILEKYLNTIYFGHNCYGLETTAEVFFGKQAKDLTLAECALLAGCIRAPNHYSPYAHPDRAIRRRALVLKKMVESGYITQEEADAAINEPVQLKEIVEKQVPAPYFIEYVKQQILEDKRFGSTASERANSLFKGGLRIHTTIDLKKQSDAENAVFSTLDRENDPDAALVCLNPKTGEIVAMVGGKDFTARKFNLAVQGHRQPGSAFKTFVLATALKEGVPATKTYSAGTFTVAMPGKDWTVTNYSKQSYGSMTVREATIHSVNCVYARMIMDVGPQKVVDMAKRLGIVTPLNPNPAIALGGLKTGVSPLEMASAYGTLANSGTYCKPFAIKKVTDANDRIIYETETQKKEVLEPSLAYQTTNILEDVIKFGTGKKANIGRPAAGKTGTTNDYKDAWFVGYTPDLVASTWVGYSDKLVPMTNVHGVRVAGGTFPAQIWAKFMSLAHEDIPRSDFAVPDQEMVTLRICAESGLRANSSCPHVVKQSFVKGTQPKRYCDIHVGSAKTKVPYVIGMTGEQASEALVASGFGVDEQEVANANYPPGQVYAQDPGGGNRIKKGTVVTIMVSAAKSNEQPGETKVMVPSVLGLPESRASDTLRNSHLTPRIQYRTTSDPEQNGIVIKQSPDPSNKLPNGGEVVVTIGKL
jgi:penicillin-binding protein 1A